jgi:hypothetical protein
MKALLFSCILALALSAKAKDGRSNVTSEGCDMSCETCFAESPDICYTCATPYDYANKAAFSLEKSKGNSFQMFFDKATKKCYPLGNREILGYGRECVECPAHSYMDPTDDYKCKNCPYECASCAYDVDAGAVSCDKCIPNTGDQYGSDDTEPMYDVSGARICVCDHTFYKGVCHCKQEQWFDFDLEECIDCGPCDIDKFKCTTSCKDHQFIHEATRCCIDCHLTCDTCSDVDNPNDDAEMARSCDICKKNDDGTQMYEGGVGEDLPMLVGDTKYCLCPCDYHEGIGHECIHN